MIPFFRDASCMGLGILSSAIATLPLGNIEKKYHALGREFFFKKVENKEEIKSHLKKIHGGRAVEIALMKPEKCLTIAYLINLAKKGSVIFSCVFMEKLFPQISVFSLFPGNEKITQLFQNAFPKTCSTAKSFAFVQKYHIFLLSPVIFKFLSIVSEIAELKLHSKKKAQESKREKLDHTLLSKTAVACHTAAQVLESVFWARIALLILAGYKNKNADVSAAIVSFVKSLIPLDQMIQTISSYDVELRAFLARAFAFFGSMTASMVISTQTRLNMELTTLSKLCLDVSNIENNIGKELNSFVNQECLLKVVREINEAYEKRQIESSDRLVFFQQIAQTIIIKFHHTMHESLLNASIEEINQFSKQIEQIREVLIQGYPLSYSNLMLTVSLYRIVKQINSKLLAVQNNSNVSIDECNFNDWIKTNSFFQQAKTQLEIITDPVPQFQIYRNQHYKNFAQCSYQEKCKVRLRYLQDQNFYNHPEHNPYQTLLSRMYGERRGRSTGNFDYLKVPQNLEIFARAYEAFANICKLLHGYDVDPSKGIDDILTNHGLACTYIGKAKTMRTEAERKSQIDP